MPEPAVEKKIIENVPYVQLLINLPARTPIHVTYSF
jgi:hypothetical protein